MFSCRGGRSYLHELAPSRGGIGRPNGRGLQETVSRTTPSVERFFDSACGSAECGINIRHSRRQIIGLRSGNSEKGGGGILRYMSRVLLMKAFVVYERFAAISMVTNKAVDFACVFVLCRAREIIVPNVCLRFHSICHFNKVFVSRARGVVFF